MHPPATSWSGGTRRRHCCGAWRCRRTRRDGHGWARLHSCHWGSHGDDGAPEGKRAVMRTAEERAVLKAHQEQTVFLELQGYLFFVSAGKVLSEIKDRIVWGADVPDAPGACNAGTDRQGERRGGVFGAAHYNSSTDTDHLPHRLPASEQKPTRRFWTFPKSRESMPSCFLMLKVLLQNGGADLVLSGASPEVLELLRSHGVVTDKDA